MRLKADLILRAYRDMGYDAVLPGEEDVLAGMPLLREHEAKGLPFVCLNLVSSKDRRPAFRPYREFSRGGLRVVVTGLLGPGLLPRGALASLGVSLLAPREALEEFLKTPDAAAADVAVVLAHLAPAETDALVRSASRPLLVLDGHARGALASAPGFRGPAALFRPADRGMELLDLAVGRGGAPAGSGAVPFGDGGRLEAARAATRRAGESGGRGAALARREARALGAIAREEGGKRLVFVNRIPLDAAVPDDPDTAAMIAAWKNALAGLAAAERAGQGVPSDYVGSRACARCHGAHVDAWEKEPHARALTTLEKRGEGANPDCIGCHVTGYRKGGYRPGPSGGGKGLAGVGCEACHGPGRGHPPKAMALPGETGCAGCHDSRGPFRAGAKMRALGCVRLRGR